MMTIEERLQHAKQKTTDAHTRKIQLETMYTTIQAKKKEHADKCAELGVEPDELAEQAALLRKEIEEALDEIEKVTGATEELPL